MNAAKKGPIVTKLDDGLVEQDFRSCGAVTTFTVRQARKAVEELIEPGGDVKLLVVCEGVKKYSYLPSEKSQQPPHYATQKMAFLAGQAEQRLIERFTAVLPNDYETGVFIDRAEAIAWLNAAA